MVRDIFGACDVDKDGFDVGETLGASVTVKGDPVAMTGSVISPAALRPKTNA